MGKIGEGDADGAVRTGAIPELRLPRDLRYTAHRESNVHDPPVSVVMPVYNREQTLGRALESVLALKDCPFEVVVVDDGSRDSTAAILKGIDDPRLTTLSLRSNRGANVARNVGIALARAPVIAFLDSDDLYSSGRLSEPLRVLAQNPDVGVVISSFTTRRGQERGAVRLRERVYDGAKFFSLVARYILPPSTSGLTVRRELLLACGGFDPSLGRIQDRDLVMRVAPLTKGASTARVLWQKHWSPDGISSQLDTHYGALCAFFERHPIYCTEELATRNYLVGRHLIALMLAGRWRRFMNVYRDARLGRGCCPRIPVFPLLLLAYAMAKWQRWRTKLRISRVDDAAPLFHVALISVAGC